MVTGLFAKFFPPPKFLARPTIGLDISDRSLKYTRLTPGRHSFEVSLFGEKAIPAGLIESGQIRNQADLSKLLQSLRQELDEPCAMVSLPEEHAFVIHLDLPYMKAADLRSSIELQLDQYIPLKPEDAVFDYEIVKAPIEHGDNYKLAVTVFPKTLMMDYHSTLTLAGFQVLAYEIEAQAIARSVVKDKNPQTIMIVDFGKTRTSFFVTSGAKVLFTSTLSNVGGENLTQSVKKNLGLSYEEAQKLKEKQGLLASNNKELIYALMPLVSVLSDEINKIYNYWNTHQSQSEGSHGYQYVEQIIVSGGQATLPGLIEYLAASFSVPVNIANVWTNILPYDRVTPPIIFNQSQKYATSLGLALRPFHD